MKRFPSRTEIEHWLGDGPDWREIVDVINDLETALVEFENDETRRRREDAFKIRQLTADLLVLERKYRDCKQEREYSQDKEIKESWD